MPPVDQTETFAAIFNSPVKLLSSDGMMYTSSLLVVYADGYYRLVPGPIRLQKKLGR